MINIIATEDKDSNLVIEYELLMAFRDIFREIHCQRNKIKKRYLRGDEKLKQDLDTIDSKLGST